jgi:hypothetical protein
VCLGGPTIPARRGLRPRRPISIAERGIVVRMEEITDESLRECAMAALQLYATADGQFRVKQEGQVKFQATFPIAMYALNQVRAALILADKNREYLAVANVRLAYEHAVTAQWVLFTEGAEEKLVGSVNRHSRQVVTAMGAHAAIPEALQTGYGRDGDPTMLPLVWNSPLLLDQLPHSATHRLSSGSGDRAPSRLRLVESC